MEFAPDLSSIIASRFVLEVIAAGSRHQGGRIAFDGDCYLWMVTIDVNSPALALDPASLNGKILRIRPEGSIPLGYPGQLPISSNGHRNVQGIAFCDGGTVFASEFGEPTVEEVILFRLR